MSDKANMEKSEAQSFFEQTWERIKADKKEGDGQEVSVTVGSVTIMGKITPQPIMASGGGFRGPPRPAFEVNRVEALVNEYPDILRIARDGSKVVVITTKYPGDDVVAKLKTTGLRWNAMTKRWESPSP